MATLGTFTTSAARTVVFSEAGLRYSFLCSVVGRWGSGDWQEGNCEMHLEG